MAGDERLDLTGSDGAPPQPTAVQEVLPLDEPVPYRLTPQGRRVVAPHEVPALRVVGDRGATHVDLDAESGTRRARARALRRTGMHTLDIADELGADPLHVEAWVGDLPVPPSAGRSRRRRQLAVVRDEPAAEQSDDDVAATWRRAAADAYDEAVDTLAADPALRTGLALLSGVFEPDHHALVLAGDRVALLAAALRWVISTLPAAEAPVRVLVRHAPDEPGDRLAHEVARELDVDVSAVATTRDPARRGLAPQVRLRCSDPVLAGRVLGWHKALLAQVAREAGGA